MSTRKLPRSRFSFYGVFDTYVANAALFTELWLPPSAISDMVLDVKRERVHPTIYRTYASIQGLVPAGSVRVNMWGGEEVDPSNAYKLDIRRAHKAARWLTDLVLRHAPAPVSERAEACMTVWPDAVYASLRFMSSAHLLTYGIREDHDDVDIEDDDDDRFWAGAFRLREPVVARAAPYDTPIGSMAYYDGQTMTLRNAHLMVYMECNRRVRAARVIARAWRAVLSRRALDVILVEYPRALRLKDVFYAHVLPKMV